MERFKVKCCQWLVIDHQQMWYPSFKVTSKHYQNKKDVWKDWGPENTESCFRPIRPIRESMIDGELADRIYHLEREKY